jgi:hypothetical protein
MIPISPLEASLLDRKNKVDELFIRIAMIADFTFDDDIRNSKIKPLASQLWEITKYQWENGELEHLLEHLHSS